jgi:transcription antitermination factor NusG
MTIDLSSATEPAHENYSCDPVLVMPEIQNKPPARLGWGGPRKNSGGPRPNCGGPQPGSGRPRKHKIVTPAYAPTVGPRWYCVVTKHGQDTRAAEGIRALGYEAWQMLCHVPARPAKRIDGRMRAARDAHNVPAISGYVFACFDASDPSWRRIVSVHGVDRILGQTPERPLALSHGAMMVLQAQCDADGVLRGTKEAANIKPLAKGSLVKIEGDGPFAGLIGLCQWSNKQRVKIVLHALGLTVEVARSEVV